MDRYGCNDCTKEVARLKARLNAEQRIAYNIIYDTLSTNTKKLSNRNAVIMIDAASGIGKTYLLSTLAVGYSEPVTFIVFRKDTASYISSMQNVTAYTYVSFNMWSFGMSYLNALKMFRTNCTDVIDTLYTLIVFAKNYKGSRDVTIIFDTYTISSPLMVLLVYILGLKYNINVIFAGTKSQQGAICQSHLHNKNNYYIARIISDLTIDTLTTNMRVNDDAKFLDKLSQFRTVMESYKPEGAVPFRFSLRYLLYTLFRSKYLAEDRFDTIYIAHYHVDITNHWISYMEHLVRTGRKFVVAPFYSESKVHPTAYQPLSIDKKGKFLPGLLLVEGNKYIHINERGVQDVIILEEIVYVSGMVDSLIICSVNGTARQKIELCVLNYYQILPAYRTWLLSGSKQKILKQFPLRMYSYTYHAALGRTIEDADVEFSTNCHTANSVYVGLNCVRSESTIHKIHANNDLLDFVVTDYMESVRNDVEFYYRCPSNVIERDLILQSASENTPNEFIDSIKWKTVKTVKKFEQFRTTRYLRIQRSKYQPCEKEMKPEEEKMTQLMKAATFIKTNPDVIHSTIQAMQTEPAKSFTEREHQILNCIWKPSYRAASSYIHLTNIFNKFVNNVEENNNKK